MSAEKVAVAVLLSGSGTNLQALIDATQSPGHPAEIVVVVSNKEDAYGLQRARDAGIDAVFISHKGKNRSSFDSELVDVLQQRGVRWVALAGFMRLLSPVFLDAFDGRVLNIHPALLPSFPGIRSQGQAIEAGVRITGATVHLVDGGTDTGPIIAQGAVPVLDDDTVDTLKARILSVEHKLFPMVLRWAVEDRIRVVAREVWVDLPAGEARFLWGWDGSD